MYAQWWISAPGFNWDFENKFVASVIFLSTNSVSEQSVDKRSTRRVCQHGPVFTVNFSIQEFRTIQTGNKIR